jgi:hypothetical protein
MLGFVGSVLAGSMLQIFTIFLVDSTLVLACLIGCQLSGINAIRMHRV